MAQDGDLCPRCQLVALTYDDSEGFLLCPSCGYVEDEVHFSSFAGNAGHYVPEDESGAITVALHGEAGHHIAKKRDYSATAIKAAHERIKGIASNLKLAQRHADEACELYKQVYQARTMNICVVGGRDALCAAVLLLTARANQQPLELRDVASSAQAPVGMVAHYLRQVAAQLEQQGAGEQLGSWRLRPSHSLRAFCLRHAAAVVQQHNQNGSTLATAHQNASGNAGNNLEGQSGVLQIASEQDVRKNQLVQASLKLCDLITKTGAGEGRIPSSIAAAAILLLGEVGGPYGHYKLLATDLASLTGCAAGTIRHSRDLLRQQLLKLAALLPMGKLINASNLSQYLPLITSATHTIVALKRKQEEQQSKQATMETMNINQASSEQVPNSVGGNIGDDRQLVAKPCQVPSLLYGNNNVKNLTTPEGVDANREIDCAQLGTATGTGQNSMSVLQTQGHPQRASNVSGRQGGVRKRKCQPIHEQGGPAEPRALRPRRATRKA